MTPRVLLVTDAAMDRHAAPGHPERPERRDAVASGVREAAHAGLVERPARRADESLLVAVHDPAYLSVLRQIDRDGGAWLDADTYAVRGSLEAARLAVGATVDVAMAVASDVAEIAFAVVRPPGHHAAAGRGSGFCLLNNIAVAVAALRTAGVASRVAIVDWDVHHGDGTQAIFDADPDVWYGSTHQVPLFPGTGAVTETGIGEAAGTKQNRPLPPGSGDEAFASAWLDDLLPRLQSFMPDAVIVSAGYDAHAADPLANLEVTEAGYEVVATALGALTTRLGLPGVALTLEGGYDLDALRASTAASVRGLLAGRQERND